MGTRINGQDIIRVTIDGHNSLSGLQGGSSGQYYHITSEVVNSSGVVTILHGGTGIPTAPTQTAFLSMAGGWASSTSGDAGSVTVGTTSGVTYKGTKFVTTADTFNTFHEFAAPMPDSWDIGTVTARPYFFTSGATSNQVITFGLQGVSLSDGDAIATSYGTAVEVAVTTSSNIAGKLIKGAATTAITIGGTPAKGDWTQFRTYRKGSDAGARFSGDVILLGWYLSYTTSGYTDT